MPAKNMFVCLSEKKYFFKEVFVDKMLVGTESVGEIASFVPKNVSLL